MSKKNNRKTSLYVNISYTNLGKVLDHSCSSIKLFNACFFFCIILGSKHNNHFSLDPRYFYLSNVKLTLGTKAAGHPFLCIGVCAFTRQSTISCGGGLLSSIYGPSKCWISFSSSFASWLYILFFFYYHPPQVSCHHSSLSGEEHSSETGFVSQYEKTSNMSSNPCSVATALSFLGKSYLVVALLVIIY